MSPRHGPSGRTQASSRDSVACTRDRRLYAQATCGPAPDANNTTQHAFRGELVPSDQNDEPASVLLQRIRAERQETPTLRSSRA
jgi:hypothetical protein